MGVRLVRIIRMPMHYARMHNMKCVVYKMHTSSFVILTLLGRSWKYDNSACLQLQLSELWKCTTSQCCLFRRWTAWTCPARRTKQRWMRSRKLRNLLWCMCFAEAPVRAYIMATTCARSSLERNTLIHCLLNLLGAALWTLLVFPKLLRKLTLACFGWLLLTSTKWCK